MVYQINSTCIRLLWIGEKRTEESFQQFFKKLGAERCKLVEYVCSDMWKPYLKVIQNTIPQAIHILDRFHIVARINKAVDVIRAGEHRHLKKMDLKPY